MMEDKGGDRNTPGPSTKPADRLRLIEAKTVHEGWSTLKVNTFEWTRSDGRRQRQVRETYDHGDSAAILLYDLRRRTVILIRQFRYPAHVNGDDDLLVEVPAGMLDAAAPEARIRAETEEETGYRPRDIRKIFDAFMSPGSLTERTHFFVAAYEPEDRISEGGGAEGEGEDIEVLETPFDDALAMIAAGEIRDAKTIMLLQHAALRIFTG